MALQPGKEPTLHELNMQQREMEAERRRLRQETGDAAVDLLRERFARERRSGSRERKAISPHFMPPSESKKAG